MDYTGEKEYQKLSQEKVEDGAVRTEGSKMAGGSEDK